MRFMYKKCFFWNESNVQCLSVRGSNTKRKTICSQSEESLWFWNAPGTTYNWYLIWNKTRPFFNWANLETMISSKFDVSNKLWFFNLLRRSVFFVVVLIVSLVSFLFSVCIFSFGSKKRIFFHHLLKKTDLLIHRITSKWSFDWMSINFWFTCCRKWN